MELTQGTRIGRYTVLEHVGTGTAEVYRAHDETLGRPVAVKVLHGTDERMRAEAQAVAQLDHPHIVAMIEVLEHEGRLCLVQEWIDGDNLAVRLRESGRLDLPETLRMGHDVASALAHAHARGILHRDIKPSNVLRTRDGRYKLADFGAVGRLQPETGETQAGVIAGTPLYMSPEQLTGARQSPASDLFGLGLLLYQCVYGHLPGEGSQSYFDLASSRVRQIAVPPSPLQPLLKRLLQVDPGQRIQSATEVIHALASEYAPATGGPSETFPGPVPAGLPGSWAPGEVTEAELPPRPSSYPIDQAIPRAARRSPRAIWVGLAVIATLLLGLAVLLTRSDLVQEPAGGYVPSGTGLARAIGGLAIVGVAWVLALWIRDRWTSREPETARQAANVIFGAGGREELTQSLIFEVDQVIRRLNTLDARVLGMTILILVRQLEEAKEWSHRQQALLDMVTVMEKIQRVLSPWHVRHKDAIATGIAVVGAMTGIASVVSGFLG